MDVSDVICRIVGKNVKGMPLAQTREDGMTVYVLWDTATEEVYRVLPTNEGWIVLLMEEKGTKGILGDKLGIRTIWTTQPEPVIENAKKLIEALLPNGHTLDLRFSCEVREMKTDISRKTFNSSVGPIRLHSRRASGGTEGAIEECQSQTCIQFFHTAETGVVEVTGKCDGIPF